ncbi:MAG TPA: glucosamine-6-phosphate deaminase [Dongiaceae bacterium]
MQLHLTKSAEQMAEAAAQEFLEVLKRKPAATVALPTGNTPLILYSRLAALRREGRFSCDRARFFNLDEFIGKSAEDDQSYAAFLWRHAFQPLEIAPGQVRLLRGDAADPRAECLAFEQAIADAGGIDLAILGLGANGHIAFNEPGSSWDSETHEIVLTLESRRGQLGLFATEAEVPPRAITMGVKTIRSARQILLLVSGWAKSNALAALLRKGPDPQWPVTALLDHPNLTVLAEEKLVKG